MTFKPHQQCRLRLSLGPVCKPPSGSFWDTAQLHPLPVKKISTKIDPVSVVRTSISLSKNIFVSFCQNAAPELVLQKMQQSGWERWWQRSLWADRCIVRLPHSDLQDQTKSKVSYPKPEELERLLHWQPVSLTLAGTSQERHQTHSAGLMMMIYTLLTMCYTVKFSQKTVSKKGQRSK